MGRAEDGRPQARRSRRRYEAAGVFQPAPGPSAPSWSARTVTSSSGFASRCSRNHATARASPWSSGTSRAVAEQLARLREIRDVVRHLAEERGRERHVRLDAQLGRDPLRAVHERVPLAVGEVDRLVDHPALRERLDAAGDPVDAVVDVGEVEGLVLASVDRDRLPAEHRVDEQRDHPHHPMQVVVVPAVDVGEPEDEVGQAVAAGVGVDERLARDLRRGVRALRVREVRGLLVVALEAMHVAVHLAARGEDDRDASLARVLEDVERHHRVLERPVRLADELVHLRVRRQVHHEIGLRVLDPVDPAREGRVVPGEVLEQVRERVGPGVEPLVDPEHVVAGALEAQGQVRADLPR